MSPCTNSPRSDKQLVIRLLQSLTRTVGLNQSGREGRRAGSQRSTGMGCTSQRITADRVITVSCLWNVRRTSLYYSCSGEHANSSTHLVSPGDGSSKHLVPTLHLRDILANQRTHVMDSEEPRMDCGQCY